MYVPGPDGTCSYVRIPVSPSKGFESCGFEVLVLPFSAKSAKERTNFRKTAVDPRKLLQWSYSDLPLILAVLAALFSWASTPDPPPPAVPNALLHSVLGQVSSGTPPPLTYFAQAKGTPDVQQLVLHLFLVHVQSVRLHRVGVNDHNVLRGTLNP